MLALILSNQTCNIKFTITIKQKDIIIQAKLKTYILCET